MYISVTYEQDSREYHCTNSSRYVSALLDIKLVLIPIIASLTYLGIILIPKKISQHRIERKHQNFISSIENEIATVRNTLQRDGSSVHIFPTNTWDSITKDIKRKIFNTYVDYKIIDDFYNELKIRDNAFLDNKFLPENVKEFNMNILKLANNAVMKINWTKYYDTKMTSTNNILLLPAVIILTAIFITYFCENILLNFRNIYKEDFSFFVFFLTSFILRSIVTYYLIQIIFDRFKRYMHDSNKRNSSLLFSHFYSKYGKLILFAISAAIMGLPSYFITNITFSFFSLLNIDILSSLKNNSSLTGIFITLDIIRMAILVMLIPKVKVTVTKLYFILALISGICGLLYIILAQQIDYHIVNKFIISPLLANFTIDGVDLHDFFLGNRSIIILPIFTFLGFVCIGIVQIIWSLIIRKKRNIIWHFFGISASIASALMLALGLLIIPMIINELGASNSHRILLNMYDDLYPLLNLIPITSAIISLHLLYILVTFIVLNKDNKSLSNTERIITVPTEDFYHLKIKKVNKKLVLSISLITIVLIFMLIIFGTLLAQDILVMIDSTIPISRNQTVTSLTVNPITNTIYGLIHKSNDFPMSKETLIVINGTTNHVEKNITLYDLSDFASEIAINSATNMIYVLSSSSLIVVDGSSNEIVDRVIIDRKTSANRTIYFRDIAINSATNMTYLLGLDPDIANLIYIFEIEEKTNRILYPSIIITRQKPLSENFQTEFVNLVVNSNNMIYVAEENPAIIYAINGTSKNILPILFDNPILTNSKDFFSKNMVINTELDTIYLIQDDSIYAIKNTTKNLITKTFGVKVNALDVNQNNSIIYAALNNGSIYAIDGINGIKKDEINLDIGAPLDIVVNPITNNIYITSYGGSMIYLLNDTTNLISDGYIPPFKIERVKLSSNLSLLGYNWKYGIH